MSVENRWDFARCLTADQSHPSFSVLLEHDAVVERLSEKWLLVLTFVDEEVGHEEGGFDGSW